METQLLIPPVGVLKLILKLMKAVCNTYQSVKADLGPILALDEKQTNAATQSILLNQREIVEELSTEFATLKCVK